MSLELNFNEASNYLSKHTYLVIEDAENLLKTLVHSQGFTNQFGTKPTDEQMRNIAQYSTKESSFYHRNKGFKVDFLNKVIKKVNSTPPNLNK